MVDLAANAWMYLRARRELKKTGEPWGKYFRFHRSESAWVRDYVTLARARGLPTWPVYVHWVAWLAALVIVILWLIHQAMQR